MEKTLNTIIQFEMADGQKVEMTLNYWALYQLRGKETETETYDEYNKIMARGVKEELDMTVILYTGYLCANLNKQCMGYEEFLQRCPTNRAVVRATVGALTTPKKQ